MSGDCVVLDKKMKKDAERTSEIVQLKNIVKLHLKKKFKLRKYIKIVFVCAHVYVTAICFVTSSYGDVIRYVDNVICRLVTVYSLEVTKYTCNRLVFAVILL